MAKEDGRKFNARWPTKNNHKLLSWPSAVPMINWAKQDVM